MDKAFAIFDMDGTLVDSMGYWRRLGREYLEGKGVAGDIRPVLRQTKSMTMTESAALFLRVFHLSGTAEQIAADMNAMMEAHYRRDIPLKSRVEAYLSRLRGAGIRMCVASATVKPLMEACLARLGVRQYFEFLLSCEEVGAGKDRPDVFLEAAGRFCAAPSEIAVYEDALHAARTAKAAGFFTVAVYDESGKSEWEELTALADEVISDWSGAAQTL